MKNRVKIALMMILVANYTAAYTRIQELNFGLQNQFSGSMSSSFLPLDFVHENLLLAVAAAASLGTAFTVYKPYLNEKTKGTCNKKSKFKVRSLKICF